MSLIEAALRYAALGWPVVPLHTPDGQGVCDCPKKVDCGRNTGKHPRTMHGLEDASTEEAKIRRWWSMWPTANIGVDLARAGLVDLAPDGIEWYAEFEARGMPPTLTFASGGGAGHEHHLYARTADCPIYRLTETGQYDVLSAGYAVMPPSLHQSLRLYTWLDPADPEDLTTSPYVPEPEWVVAMLRAKQKPPTGVGAVPRDPGAPPVALRGEALERWYGRAYDTSPETGALDRSYSLWRLAVVLLDAGCAPHFVEDLLAERDMALGWTKFSGRRNASVRYHVIVDRAVRSKGPRRIVLGQGPASSVNGTGRAPSRPRLVEWLTAAEIAAMEDEHIVWHAFGMLGGGLITELDGKVKQAGKTTLVLAMVRAILEGEPFLGQATTYSPIVYLTEQSGPSFKRNLRRAGLLGRNDLHVLLFHRAIGMKWEYVVAQATAYAAQVGARVLIVDTLGQFSGVRGDTENSAGTAMVVMEPLQAAAATGLAIFVSRHDRKSGGEVGDSGRGSSAYAGAVDIVLHLQRLTGNTAGKERQRLLEGISRFEETPDKILVELGPQEPYVYTALGDADVVRDQVLRRDILANLPTNPDDALSTGELKEAVGGKDEDRGRVLRALVREGFVRRLGLGKAGDPYRYFQHAFDDDD